MGELLENLWGGSEKGTGRGDKAPHSMYLGETVTHQGHIGSRRPGVIRKADNQEKKTDV